MSPWVCVRDGERLGKVRSRASVKMTMTPLEAIMDSNGATLMYL